MKKTLLNAIAAILLTATVQGHAATAATTCDKSSASNMVATCTPDITFYAGGTPAVREAVEYSMYSVFDNTKPIAALLVENDPQVVGYMGTLSSAAVSGAGKTALVFFNGKNGAVAAVTQLYSGLKTGLVENNFNQQEHITLQTLTPVDVKAGKKLTILRSAPSGNLGNDQIYVSQDSGNLATITLPSSRKASFALGWGTDKQKVMHLAISDLRPSEFSPGQFTKVDEVTYPPISIGIQAFGVAVNGNLYADLVARDVAAKRLPSDCSSVSVSGGALSGPFFQCQPTMGRAEIASILTSTGLRNLSDLKLGGQNGSSITYYRLPRSSSIQAAAQLQFLNQGSYAFNSSAKSSADWSIDASVIGNPYAVLVNGLITAGCSTKIVATSLIGSSTCSGTSDVVSALTADTGYAIGVVELAKLTAAFDGKGAFVKLDGMSGTIKPDGNEDTNARVGLQFGYPFAYEMFAMRSKALTSPYSDIASNIIVSLQTPSNNTPGVAYIGDTVDSRGTVFSRGGRNNKPLTMFGIATNNPAYGGFVYGGTIGGTVTGLASGQHVNLSNNGGDVLTVNSNQAFTFPAAVNYNATYSVAVAANPTGQTCTVANGSGSKVTSNVSNVSVTCSNNLYTIGGSVSGLSASESVTLLNSANSDSIVLSANGSFTMSKTIHAYADSYSISLGSKPSGKICVVTNGSGNSISSNVTNITVACNASSTISGSVSGLAVGKQVVLANNGIQKTISADGSYSFEIPYNGNYNVTVTTQPALQTCTVSNGIGTNVTTNNVNNINVNCVGNPFTVGGAVFGLGNSNQVTLLLNGANPITVSSNGNFVFTNTIPAYGNYSVTVGTQPNNQTCGIAYGSGTNVMAAVSNIVIVCSP